MTLTTQSVERPISTLMAVLAVCLGGIIALITLPVDLMPNTESSMVTVFVGVRGGMPPEDIEHLVTEPIEEAIATMPGLQSVLSVSRKDKATVTLNFDESADVKRASLDVSERLARIKGKMPKEIEKPIVARYNENDQPIVILSATSTMKSPEVLRSMIEHDLKPTLSRVPGVANVEIGGGRQRKILVEFEKAKLEAHNLSILDVIHQLGANNLSMMSGRYETKRDAWGVQFVGDFRSLDEMRNLGIAITKEGSRIRLGDVAVVRDYYLEPESYARVNSQPSVSIYVQKETGANTIRVAQEVLKEVHAYQKKLPPDVGFGISSDQSVSILQAIADIRDALTWGAFLTAIVLIVFLKNVRQVGVIIVSIPVAILGTFLAMLLHGPLMERFFHWPPITINVMSLLGVALGIGRMVDDSIVTFENILHRYELGLKKGEKITKKLVVDATGEMALSVASSTLVMVVIFLPIIFISADVRRLFADVAFTVVASLFASLLMAFTVVPLLAYRTFSIPHEKLADLDFEWEKKLKLWLAAKMAQSTPERPQESAGTAKKKIVLYATSGLYWINKGVTRFRNINWSRLLRRGTALSIRHRYRLMGGILISMIFSALIYSFALEKEFMGNGEKKEFIIFVELPAGSKLDVSDKVVSAVEAEINAIPEVRDVVKTVSSRVEGWSSKIYVTLAPGRERSRTVQSVIDDLRPKLKSIGGEYEAFVYFSEAQASQEMTIDVFGKDYLALRDVAVDIAKRMQSVKGLRDVKLRYKPGQPEVRLDIDHARSAMFGLNSKDIAETLHAEIRGLRATYFNAGSDQVETVARLSEEDRRTEEQISNLTLMSNTQHRTLVPVQQVLKMNHDFTPSEVWRKDKERVIQVSANRERLALSTAVTRIQKALVGLHVPTGYHYEFGGDYKKLVKSEEEFLYAFIIMIAMVYMVLACFFESYSQPLLMLLTIPLATAGSMPALWITKTSVNMGVYIGLLMLGGTVVSNGIILIDRLNTMRKHRSLIRCAMTVGLDRARPIFMTSLTTIAAMLPLTVSKGESSDLWAPLALTVVSGLALSSVLTLFAIPAAYIILDSVMIKFETWKRGPALTLGAVSYKTFTPS